MDKIKRDNKGRFIKGNDPSKLKGWRDALKKRVANYKPKKIQKKCLTCKKAFEVSLYRKNTAKFCSMSCRSINIGKIRRKKAVPILRHGYMYIRRPSYHRSKRQGGYAKIADLVLEQKIGRLLKENEIAHHIDECKTNDSPDNLLLMTKKQHDNYHLNKRWQK